MKYRGVELEQDINTLSVFRQFLSKEIFDIIIELGTKYGGFTQFLTEFHNNIHTFDWGKYMKSGLLGYLKHMNVKVYVQDIFSDNTYQSQGVSLYRTNTVTDLIQNNKRVLLLCDNGNKILEVQKFTNNLKSNDVIMAHDYFPTENDLYHKVDGRRAKRWSSHEISAEHFDDSVLEPFYAEDFENVFWACRRKK